MVSLVMLLLLAVLSTTVFRTNTLQARMAGNDEAHLAALQLSLAVVDGVMARTDNFAVDGPVGNRNCAADNHAPDCDQHTLSIEASALPVEGSVSYAVTRQGPLLATLPVMDESRVSSSAYYQAALFEISVNYRAATARGGRVNLVQGLRRRVVGERNQ